MNEPLVVLIYHKKGGYQTYLEQQLEAAGIERHDVVMDSFSWRKQLLGTYAVARQFPDRLLLVIDAWDQVLLGTKKELLKHAQDALLGHVTLAGARFCWPTDRRADYARRRGPEPSPWCYINNSPLAGLGRDIAKAIEYGMDRFPIEKDDDTCHPSEHVPERFWTQLYLEGPLSLNLRIDTECVLNQTFLALQKEEFLIKRSRIFNKVTGEWPIFLHLNRGSVLPYGLA